MPRRESQRVAPIGERMIEIKVRFWTDKIATKPGDIVPKNRLD
jgi:hypothetical protein